MDLTVRQLLQLNSMRGSCLLTAGQQALSANIGCVSVIEAPVENFVRDRELVLTTAAGLWDDPGALPAFTKEIYDSGAAALVLASKEKTHPIPSQVIQFCMGRAFPLLLLPWERRFSEIIEEIHQYLLESELQDLSFYDGLQKELISSYLSDGSLSDAAQIVSHRIGCPVCITDTSGKLRGVCGKLAGLRVGDPAAAENFTQKVSIYANGKPYGFLFFDDTTGNQMAVVPKGYFEKYVATPLTLWFDREHTIDATRMKLKNDFIWSLARGDLDAEERRVQASRMGFRIDLPYTCVIGRISPPAQGGGPSGDESALVGQLLEIGKRRRQAVMVTLQNEDLIFYLQTPPSGALRAIHLFLDEVEDRLGKTLPAMAFTWGIGDIQENGCEFHKGYLTARLALELCKNGAAANRCAYRDTGLHRIISAISGNPEVEEVARSLLQSLYENAKIRRLCLLETFQCYLNNNCNVSKTSRELHLHRQSLVYRLHKLEEITGLSLEDHNDQFLLDLCSRLSLDFPFGDAAAT